MGNYLSVLLILLMFVLGVIYCFWGYRYLKVIIVIYALFGGFYLISLWLSDYMPQLGNWVWIIGLVVGIVLALLAFFFIKFTIFLAGGMIGIMVYFIIKALNPAFFGGLVGWQSFMIGLLCFLVLGFITLALRRHVIIIFTSIFGSYTMVYCVGMLIGLFSHPELISTATVQTATSVFAPISIFAGRTWLQALLAIVFAVIGIITQYRLTRPPERRDTRLNRRKGL